MLCLGNMHVHTLSNDSHKFGSFVRCIFCENLCWCDFTQPHGVPNHLSIYFFKDHSVARCTYSLQSKNSISQGLAQISLVDEFYSPPLNIIIIIIIIISSRHYLVSSLKSFISMMAQLEAHL